jgi:GNAT superfamily N-acetyltransferase
MKKKYVILQAKPSDYEALGEMTVTVYEQLPGMPDSSEQPEYYSMLKDVESRARIPTIKILIAVTPENELLGGVTFIGDVKYYASGGTVSENINCSGIRLLVVKPEARNSGIGKALTEACIQRAKDAGTSQVVLHTTKSMEIAWRMYEKIGFLRSPDLDFHQGKLAVYGFRLKIDSPKF